MSWLEQTSMMAPKEERAFWLTELKRRALSGYGMAVNCRHGPSLDKTHVLRKLVEDGIILRRREWRGNKCYRTVLYFPLEPIPAP